MKPQDEQYDASMKLLDKQVIFTRSVARLIRQAYSLSEDEDEEASDRWTENYYHKGRVELTLGRAYASEAANKADKGITGSTHTMRLAIDLNLFVDGEYIVSFHPIWHVLGRYWKKLNPDLAEWGGDFRKKDYNHFSFHHGGKR